MLSALSNLFLWIVGLLLDAALVFILYRFPALLPILAGVMVVLHTLMFVHTWFVSRSLRSLHFRLKVLEKRTGVADQ